MIILVRNLSPYNIFWSFISLNHQEAKVISYFLIISVVMTMFNLEAFAIDTTIGVNAGYDNNVHSTPDESESSFTAYRLNLTQQVSHEKMFGKSSFYFNSFYKNYSQFDNNLSVNAGTNYSCFPGDNRLMTLGLVEAGIYRDNENDFDELNWIKTGGQLKYFYNGRISFQFLQFFYWNHYLEPVEHIIENESALGSGNTNIDLDIKLEQRDDFYILSNLGMTAQLHPKLNMTIFPMYNRLLSNIKTETYDGIGGSIFFRFSPGTSWGISAETSLWKNDFPVGPRVDLWSVRTATMACLSMACTLCCR